ncbi:hypothetical protein ABPG72_000394 [Tetrahymena utriculariae]
MSINIKNISNGVAECLSVSKDKIDSILNLLKVKNNYGQLCYYDYDKTNLVLLTQNLILQKQVVLQIIELKDPQFFGTQNQLGHLIQCNIFIIVNKEIDGFLISQTLIQNFQIDEFDLKQYLSKRKVNLIQVNLNKVNFYFIKSYQLNLLKVHDSSSLHFVRQIEDSAVQSIQKNIILLNFFVFQNSYNKSIKDFILLNDIQECKCVDYIYLNLQQSYLNQLILLNVYTVKLNQTILHQICYPKAYLAGIKFKYQLCTQILMDQILNQLLNQAKAWKILAFFLIQLQTYRKIKLIQNNFITIYLQRKLDRILRTSSNSKWNDKSAIENYYATSEVYQKLILLPFLQNLNSRENQIGSNGVKALGQLFENQQQLNSLFLNLSFNKIKSDGASSLIQGVSKCNQIKDVNINLQYLYQIIQKQIKIFQINKRNNQIRQLKELSNHILTQKGLKSLDVYLQNNKINFEEQSYLAQIITELKNTKTYISLLQTTQISNSQDVEEEFQQSIKLQKVCPKMITSLGSKLASLTQVQSLSIQIKNCQIEETQISALGQGLQHCQSLKNLMIEINGSKISEYQQIGFISFINQFNISKISIRSSDLKIEINSQQFKVYELAFKSVGFPLYKMLCDNLCRLCKFMILKFDLKFCKIGETGIIYLAEQLTKLQNLKCLHVVAMISDIGQRGITQFFKITKTIKGISKMTFEYYGNSLFDAERKKFINIGIKAPYLVEFCFTN